MEPGYTCVTTFQMMPIAARQERGHYSNMISVHYSEGNIFHVTSETLFKELSQFSYQLWKNKLAFGVGTTLHY